MVVYAVVSWAITNIGRELKGLARYVPSNSLLLSNITK